jgi:hypothetical protein
LLLSRSEVPQLVDGLVTFLQAREGASEGVVALGDCVAELISPLSPFTVLVRECLDAGEVPIVQLRIVKVMRRLVDLDCCGDVLRHTLNELRQQHHDLGQTSGIPGRLGTTVGCSGSDSGIAVSTAAVMLAATSAEIDADIACREYVRLLPGAEFKTQLRYHEQLYGCP